MSPTNGAIQSAVGPNGGAGRIRTGDPLLAKQMLYQLSYDPEMVERRIKNNL
jgi:hypothetical protein